MTLGVELHQIERHLAHGLAGPLLGLAPGGAAHAVEIGRLLGGGAVAAEAAQLVSRHPQQAIGLEPVVIGRKVVDGRIHQQDAQSSQESVSSARSASGGRSFGHLCSRVSAE